MLTELSSPVVLAFIFLGLVSLKVLFSLSARSATNSSAWSIRSEPLAIKFKSFGSLLTDSEKKFYNAIKENCPPGLLILCKTRVADVIEPDLSKQSNDWTRLFRKVSEKHFDFVVCDRSSMKPLCAIELNDKSQERQSRTERDKLLKEACDAASFELVFLQTHKHYRSNFFKEIFGLVSLKM